MNFRSSRQLTTKTYRQTVLEWRMERDESIRRENSWLALSGLFWLKRGKNRVGSDSSCEIQLPARAPAQVGVLDFNGRSVTLQTAGGVKVSVNDKPATFAILQPDVSTQPSYVVINDIRLVVIERGSKFGVRMWDNQRADRRAFPRRTWFDIDERFIFPATFVAYDKPKMAFFPDVAGEKAEHPVDGYVAFSFKGRDYKLDVSKEEGNELFIRFWDPTAETETYPTGRYLVAELAKDNSTALDFNKAYNPPCAFTDFATCVFAPEQNRLDFKIEAGETYTKKH